MSLQGESLSECDKAELDPSHKELFLEAWDLKDGDLTDEQILIAIKTGQL